VASAVDSNPLRCFASSKTGEDRRPGSMSCEAAQREGVPNVAKRTFAGQGGFLGERMKSFPPLVVLRGFRSGLEFSPTFCFAKPTEIAGPAASAKRCGRASARPHFS
jgi:hypothetical protein